MDEILNFQRNEITEHNVYRTLAQKTRGSNAEVLRKISEDELHHYNEWKKFTQKDVGVNQLTSLKFLLISAILGLTFTTKMMENGEKHAKNAYADVVSVVPDAKRILEDETTHEKQLLAMINEEKIGYVGSMVLDVNDALVELTGALAGFTFTFLNSRLIGVAGLITGIAVSLSMAASEYLSQKSEKGKSPLRASLYTWLYSSCLSIVFRRWGRRSSSWSLSCCSSRFSSRSSRSCPSGGFSSKCCSLASASQRSHSSSAGQPERYSTSRCNAQGSEL